MITTGCRGRHAVAVSVYCKRRTRMSSIRVTLNMKIIENGLVSVTYFVVGPRTSRPGYCQYCRPYIIVGLTDSTLVGMIVLLLAAVQLLCDTDMRPGLPYQVKLIMANGA